MVSKCNKQQAGQQQKHEASAFDFTFLQSGFLLHHRREAQRQVQVSVFECFYIF
jgi:hypothetical protein